MEAIKNYYKNIKEKQKTKRANEHTLRTDLENLLNSYKPNDIKILQEAKKEDYEQGTPDFKVFRRIDPKDNLSYNLLIGYIETKKLNEDISVPRSMLPVALNEIYKIGKKYGLDIPCFGHAGDGNIHVNVMVKDKNNPEEVEKGHKAIEDIFKMVVELGGTLSGEHGIGISKAQFMNIAFTEEEINLFKRLKKAFDPNGILNPGKMGI